jgi:hypothetical protein
VLKLVKSHQIDSDTTIVCLKPIIGDVKPWNSEYAFNSQNWTPQLKTALNPSQKDLWLSSTEFQQLFQSTTVPIDLPRQFSLNLDFAEQPYLFTTVHLA